jgi:hypothetical protein
VTGLPNRGNVAPRQQELARLRTFCVLNAVLYLVVAALVAFLRVLIGEPVAVALLAQELLCAVVLVVLAASLLRVRGAIAGDPAGQGPAVGVGRRVGAIALGLAGLCVLGAVVVLLLPSAESKVPTALVSVVAVVFALYAYAGTTKLRRN